MSEREIHRVPIEDVLRLSRRIAAAVRMQDGGFADEATFVVTRAEAMAAQRMEQIVRDWDQSNSFRGRHER